MLAGVGPGSGRLSLRRGGPTPKPVNLSSIKASDPEAGADRASHGETSWSSSGADNNKEVVVRDKSVPISWAKAAAPKEVVAEYTTDDDDDSASNAHGFGHGDRDSGYGDGGVASGGDGIFSNLSNFNWADAVETEENQRSQGAVKPSGAPPRISSANKSLGDAGHR